MTQHNQNAYMTPDFINNSRGKKSGRATYSSNILKKRVNFGLIGHVSLLVDYSFCISTYICISQYF